MTPQPIPSDKPDDFTERPFVAGALVGRRAFRVVRDSGATRLWGPVYSFSWSTHDTNVAECRYGMSPIANPPARGVASMGCSCGFWAYFQETPETRTYRNSVHDGIGIEGIIFGFGRATAGTLGFRCAKARILALVQPDEYEDQLLLEDAMRKFDGVRWYDTFDAAVSDWPLSKAARYGFTPPVEGVA